MNKQARHHQTFSMSSGNKGEDINQDYTRLPRPPRSVRVHVQPALGLSWRLGLPSGTPGPGNTLLPSPARAAQGPPSLPLSAQNPRMPRPPGSAELLAGQSPRGQGAPLTSSPPRGGARSRAMTDPSRGSAASPGGVRRGHTGHLQVPPRGARAGLRWRVVRTTP